MLQNIGLCFLKAENCINIAIVNQCLQNTKMTRITQKIDLCGRRVDKNTNSAMSFSAEYMSKVRSV